MPDLTDTGIIAGLVTAIITGERVIEYLVKKKRNGSGIPKLNGELSKLNAVLTRLDMHNENQVKIMDKTAERLFDIAISQEKMAVNQTSLTDKIGDVVGVVNRLPEGIRHDVTGATERIIAVIRENK